MTPSAKARTCLLSFVLAAGAGMVVKQIVLAVHDTGAFELDGNAISLTSDDWDRVCHQVSGSDCSTTFNTNGAVQASWASDDAATFFALVNSNSKDNADMDQWSYSNGPENLNVPNERNLLHTFAVHYSLPPTDPGSPGTQPCFNGTGGAGQPAFNPAIPCEVLYFGSDRLDNSGRTVQGFWFFQNAISLTADGHFTGLHTLGDLLVVVDFSNSDVPTPVSTMAAYRWNPACGGGCAATNLEALATSTAAKCGSATSDQIFCGLVNSADGTTAPWPFTDHSNQTSYKQGEFFEGGVNLSLLGLAGKCFATVLSDSRSSISLTATLQDFVLGSFGPCSSTNSSLTTTPKDGAGAAIPAGGLSIGAGSVVVKDSAVVSVTGQTTWSGTLKFFLCGPTAAASPYAACLAGGTQIGDSGGIAVNQSTTQPIPSNVATISFAGGYCWRGEFTSAAGDATDATLGECFTVNPKTPTLATTASGNVVIGNAVSDAAALSSTSNKPGSPVIDPTAPGAAAGGTITFRVYGPNDATCANPPAFTSNPIPVSGDGNYSSGNFTPSTVGMYRWVASYSGDSPNTLGASGVCNGANESVVVSPKTPTIVTSAVTNVLRGNPISDTATIGNTANQPDGNPAGGTVTFRLFASNDKSCRKAPVFTSSPVSVNGDGPYSSGNFTPTAVGTYRWIAVYTGDLPNTLGPVSTTCGDANESSVVTRK